MKVRNKITGGTTEHVRRNNETIQMLIKTGVLEVVDDTPEPGEMIRTGNGAVVPMMEPPVQPSWCVARVSLNRTDGRTVPAIVFEVGTTVHEAFTGEPGTGAWRFSKSNVPGDIAKEYARTHKEFYGRAENHDLRRYMQGF